MWSSTPPAPQPPAEGDRSVLAGGALIGGGPFFGLASGISWGAGDFAGGLIGRYASTLLAVLVSQGLGLAVRCVLLGAERRASARSGSR